MTSLDSTRFARARLTLDGLSMPISNIVGPIEVIAEFHGSEEATDG